MTRPPLISTDMASPSERGGWPPGGRPPVTLLLLAAGRYLDFVGLPVGPVHVLAVVLELLDGRLGIVRDVRLVAAGLVLDDLVVEGDRGRVLEVVGVHDPDALVVRPDELVDLVELPALVALAERRP